MASELKEEFYDPDIDIEELNKSASLNSENKSGKEHVESDSYESPDEEEVHEFSVPWRNSDLVLVIEEQKLHVHRLILELASPVLCQLFKETDSTEVPLLRTKINEFVDLLRVIYPQFDDKITRENVVHIYRLAEEYQIEAVIKKSREYLMLAKKTTSNAMKILVMAQVCKADEARQQCYKELQKLTMSEIESDQHFKELDEESLRNVLLPKAKRLEECLRKIQPQLVGLIDCVLYLWLHPENTVKMYGMPKQCQEHHTRPEAYTSMQKRIKCSACKAMFIQMATNSTCTRGGAWNVSKSRDAERRGYYSSTGVYFDRDIVDALKDMFGLLKI